MSANELRDVLSLKIIIKELYLLKKEVIIQWNVWQKGFVVACNHINRKNAWSS